VDEGDVLGELGRRGDGVIGERVIDAYVGALHMPDGEVAAYAADAEGGRPSKLHSRRKRALRKRSQRSDDRGQRSAWKFPRAQIPCLTQSRCTWLAVSILHHSHYRNRAATMQTHASTAQNSNKVLHHVISEELELEIGIRQRLAETIEGRIAWAVQLRKSLLSGVEGQEIGTRSSQTGPYIYSSCIRNQYRLPANRYRDIGRYRSPVLSIPFP
jgi:hypothetical protein